MTRRPADSSSSGRPRSRAAFPPPIRWPSGPGAAAPPSTDLHTEGPSVLHTGGWWYVYYDEYPRGHYGAVRTRDFERWEPFRDSLRTPRGIRHGSAFTAPVSVLRALLAADSTSR